MNHSGWRSAIAGGNWNEGTRYGSRTLNLNTNPWNANGNIGARGVSDAFMMFLLEVRLSCLTQSIFKDQPKQPGASRQIIKIMIDRDTKPSIIALIYHLGAINYG